MIWPDKRMRDLMKDCVMDMRRIGMPHIMPGQRNHTPCVVTLASAAARMIQPDGPTIKAMLAHQIGRCIQRRLQRPVTNCGVSWLHARQAISQLRWPPESRQDPPR